jgi:hypothetical protein
MTCLQSANRPLLGAPSSSDDGAMDEDASSAVPVEIESDYGSRCRITLLQLLLDNLVGVLTNAPALGRSIDDLTHAQAAGEGNLAHVLLGFESDTRRSNLRASDRVR